MRISTQTVLTGLLLVAMAIPAWGQRRKVDKEVVMGDTMYTMMGPGDIPPILEPEFISLADAESLYAPNEPVLVVTRGDDARAYSTWHLDHHEIVNDNFGDLPLAVTW